MNNFLTTIRNKFLYFFFFAFIVSTSALALFVAFHFCFYPEKSLNDLVSFYHSLPAQFGGKIDSTHIFYVGAILTGCAILKLTVLCWVRSKIFSSSVINYKNPRVSININQFEKSLKESLSILSGINKSVIKIVPNRSGYVIKVKAKIYVDEGVHVVQLEKSVNYLMRKRVREILLGISVDVRPITRIFIQPDKNYVSYNVLAEQTMQANNRNFINTNFPDSLDPAQKSHS